MKIRPLFLAAALFVPAFSTVGQCASTRSVVCYGPRPTVASRSWVILKAATDQPRYTPGQPITVRLNATNTHSSGAYLRFTSGQRFDFSVYKVGTKDTVYSWSASRMFAQSTGSLWIRPGQNQEFEANIGDEMGQLKPGNYRLQAHLTSSPRSVSAAPIFFEIVDLGIAMTTRTDKTTYKIGEPVKIDMTVANRKTNGNSIPFRSSQIFDVFVADELGNPIWNYGANVRFAQNRHDEIWKKGETKKYATAWDGRHLGSAPALLPGRYRVQGVLQSTPLLYATPVFIDIAR